MTNSKRIGPSDHSAKIPAEKGIKKVARSLVYTAERTAGAGKEGIQSAERFSSCSPKKIKHPEKKPAGAKKMVKHTRQVYEETIEG